MSVRRSTVVAVLAGAASIVVVASWVTAEAVSSSSGVRGCETARGYLTLPTSAGHCPQGSHGVTIGERGPRGAVGPAGVATARIVTGPIDVRLPAGTLMTSHNSVIPSTTTVISARGVAAGSYLVTGTLDLRNDAAAGGGDVQCHTSATGSSATATGEWGQTVPAGAEAAATLTGGVRFTGTQTVSILCNSFITGGDATVTVSQILLTPVATLQVTRG